MKRLAVVAAALAAVACQGAGGARPAEPLGQALQADGLTRAERTGREVFVGRCATCHGETGGGEGQNAYTLDPPPPDLRQSLPRTTPAYWRRVVEGGTSAVGRSALCPPWGRSLSKYEVDAVVAYLGVLARGAKDAPPAAPAP